MGPKLRAHAARAAFDAHPVITGAFKFVPCKTSFAHTQISPPPCRLKLCWLTRGSDNVGNIACEGSVGTSCVLHVPPQATRTQAPNVCPRGCEASSGTPIQCKPSALKACTHKDEHASHVEQFHKITKRLLRLPGSLTSSWSDSSRCASKHAPASSSVNFRYRINAGLDHSPAQ